MVRLQPALVSQADLQLYFRSNDVAAPPDAIRQHAFEGERQPELWIGGSPVRLHFDMLWEAMQPRPEYLHLIKVSAAPEWAVAATILVMECMVDPLRDEIFKAKWHQVPVENWLAVLKPKLSLPLRSSMFGEYVGAGVRALRGLMNVTTRLDQKADWTKELMERSCYWRRKVSWSTDRPLTDWRWDYQEAAQRLADKHIAKMGRGRRMEDIDEWWAGRHHAIPTGSSSERKPVQDGLLADKNFNPTDRPDKKAVAEALDNDHMHQLLLQMPQTHCRASTKREPGGKNRPLHANNDSSFFIEAYALVHAEKEDDGIEGTYGKQLGTDVLHWLDRAEEGDTYGGVWLSTDYPNYCTSHAKWELAIASLVRARAWAKTRQPELVKMQKQLASMWIAAGHFHSVLRREDDCITPYFFNENGLYSGQRATLLDHNYVHAPTIAVARKTLLAMGWVDDLVEVWITGDDEDAFFRSLVGAIGQYSATRLCGNVLNAAKQVLGRSRQPVYKKERIYDFPFPNWIDLDEATHSYLQRDLSRQQMPTRSLARITATLASGNWYAEPGIWFDSAISSTSDNFWECVSRGMPLRIAQLLAASFLDRLMIVRPTQDERVRVKKLEWWKYVPKNHPLWLQTGAGGRKPPVIVNKPEPHHSWPSAATEAWMDRVKPILEGLRPSRIEQYKKYLLQESVGRSFHHYRMREMRDCARAYWPEREKRPLIETRDLKIPMQRREVWLIISVYPDDEGQ